MTGEITPVTVIGGFLGAGKTTLINHLLSAEDAPRCAVLVNDFGEIDVDASLIESRDSNTISLKNGCVCCTMGNDLGAALSQALNLELKPERIVIEASGVAHPGKIMDVARISKELSTGGIYVLVDAAGIMQQLSDHWIADTVVQQLVAADYLVQSKIKSLAPEKQIEVVETLHKYCPQLTLLEAANITWSTIESRNETPINRPENFSHAHFITRTLRSHQSLDISRLKQWLNTNPCTYRLKGWFLDQENSVKLLQVVDQRLNIFESDVLIEGRLLVIVIGNDQLSQSEDILDAIISK